MINSLFLAVAVITFGSLLARAEAGQNPAPMLDGQTKSFVVVGYSTSFQWPDMLQFMLDQHVGKPGVYHVLNAAAGGAPVAFWTEGSDHFERTYAKMVRDYLSDEAERRGDRPRPTVALCQQSLQGTFGNFREGIRGADDRERIEKGADALQTLAEKLHRDGIETAYISTHIYKVSMEPAIEHEKYALEALLNREIAWVHRGPNLWSPTKAAYPEGFSPVDKVHPSFLGAQIMAEGWYRALAGDGAKLEVIKAMHQNPFPELKKMFERDDNRRQERRRR